MSITINKMLTPEERCMMVDSKEHKDKAVQFSLDMIEEALNSNGKHYPTDKYVSCRVFDPFNFTSKNYYAIEKAYQNIGYDRIDVVDDFHPSLYVEVRLYLK